MSFWDNIDKAAPPSDPVMPFGKHRGTKVKDVNPKYLLWLARTVDLREPLRTAVAVCLSPLRPEPSPGARKLWEEEDRYRKSLERTWAYERAERQDRWRQGYRQKADYTDEEMDFDGGINSFGDNGGW